MTLKGYTIYVSGTRHNLDIEHVNVEIYTEGDKIYLIKYSSRKGSGEIQPGSATILTSHEDKKIWILR